MDSLALHTYRLVCALLAGAQLFFAAVAAQVVFPKEVAALARGEPRRTLAADLVGQMLARLDPATLVGCALAVAAAVFLWTRGGSLRLGLWPLLAGSCAALSLLWTTPAIQALRAAGETGGGRFGMLHAVSSSLLLVEIALLAWGSVRAGR